MERTAKAIVLNIATCLALAEPTLAIAQTRSSEPGSASVAKQFASGANQVGEGATQIGEGIKNGAIMIWDAIKTGVASGANRLNGDVSGPDAPQAPPGQSR